MSLHEMSLKNIKKTRNYNIFLKNRTKISYLVPVLISLRKPKKIQKSVRFLLSTGTFSRKRAKKKRQNEFSTRYRVQNFFLFVDSVAGTKYGGFRYIRTINLSFLTDKVTIT